MVVIIAVTKKNSHAIPDESLRVFDNNHINFAERINYKGVNLNNPYIKSKLINLLEGTLESSTFARFFVDHPDIFADQEFLFKLTSVARCHFNFEQYCKLVHIFSSWNKAYERTYRAERMFKNMILQRRIGKHFPVHTPEELKQKLEMFNTLSGLGVVSYLDILDCASQDFSLALISVEEYVKIAFNVVKCADKKFGKIVCRRAYNILSKVGDIIRARAFK